MKKLEEYVKSIPDFPEKGIIFRDVTSVLQDADGLHLAIDTMQEKIKDLDYDVVVGPESRGFIFGTPIAYNNHKPFVLIRKKGKLPRETVSATYDLEYGSATTIALPAISATVTVAFGPLLHDLLVGCLDLLELFFRLILIGIVDIGIGMVFPAQCLICFFYFLLGSISAHSQNTVWIISHFPLPLLHCLSSVSSARSHNGTIHRNTEYSAEYPHSVK